MSVHISYRRIIKNVYVPLIWLPSATASGKLTKSAYGSSIFSRSTHLNAFTPQKHNLNNNEV